VSDVRYIVLFDDRFGRRSHTTSDNPVAMLARKVAEHEISPEAARSAAIYEASKVPNDARAMNAAIDHARRLHMVRDNRQVVLREIEKRKIDESGVESLRDELRSAYPLDSFDPPWPRVDDDNDPAEEIR